MGFFPAHGLVDRYIALLPDIVYLDGKVLNSNLDRHL
jgi:hypothetical protein